MFDQMKHHFYSLMSLLILILLSSSVTQAATIPANRTFKSSGCDLIVIQCEAFMDLEKVYDMSFSRDPLPKYHEWQLKSQYGLLHVPVNGGLTCNSEYEFLTSKIAAEYAYIPFKDKLYKVEGDVDSFAWDLKNLGYRTVGIHPYHKTYFNRDIVYPKLGIEKFIALESFNKPEYFGSWVKDKESFNMVLKELELSKGKDTFIYNVTTQNHAPYYPMNMKNKISVQSDRWISKEDQNALEVYATGLSLTDTAFDDFLKVIENRKKRTIVVFYGDHQPPKGYKSLGDMGYFKDNGLYSTDYLIYDNAGIIETGGVEMDIKEFREHLLEILKPIDV